MDTLLDWMIHPLWLVYRSAKEAEWSATGQPFPKN